MNENLDPTLDNSSQEERDFDRALRPKGFDEFWSGFDFKKSKSFCCCC